MAATHDGDRRWPVSVKGVVAFGDLVLLLLNERDEWELPGGRLEAGETPERCVEREVQEETGLAVTVEGIVDAWVHPVLPDRSVLIVTYRCVDLDRGVGGRPPAIEVSDEHRVARWTPVAALDELSMPVGYRRSIEAVLGGG
ncbi:MAG: NUDIX domain-containing protein [Actinomycetota bacterium]